MRASVGGLSVNYERGGTGPAVLVLHGWGASVGLVRSVVDGLATRFDVLALDLPGFGQSDLPPSPWSVGDYAEHVVAFADQCGLEKPSIVGHSFGGRIAIKLAASHPDRVDRIVLVDCAGIPSRSGLRQRLSRAAIGVGKWALAAPGLRGLRDTAADEVRRRVGSDDYRAAGALRQTFVKVVGEDLRPLLPRVQAPTLLIWGSNDDVTPVEDGRIMESEIPDAGLVVLEGAGHYSYLEQPARFNLIVSTFLSREGS